MSTKKFKIFVNFHKNFDICKSLVVKMKYSLTIVRMSFSMMSDNMKIVTRVSVTTQVVDSIRESIQNGSFKIGQKLPTELSLCKMLNVSRSSLREALHQLQAEGYVELRPGKGAFVRSVSPYDNLSSIKEWFMSNAPNLQDYTEFRIAIGPFAAELACARGTNEEVEHLKQIHAQFEEANKINDVPRLAVLDEQFHSQILTMAHNILLEKISEMLLDGLKQYRMMSIKAKDNSDSTVIEHATILAAIIAKNAQAAAKAMLYHLTKAREGINSFLPEIVSTEGEENESKTA